METIIKPDDYTLEIIACIKQIKYRMEMTLINFSDDDVIVIENDGIIYILGNPILGEEPIFDEAGNFERMVPLHNITLMWPDNWLRTKIMFNHIKFMAKIPRLRIMRPDLCMRIGLDKTITDGSNLC